MAYIPENSQWYVAEIIEEIVVEGDSRNVIHKNLVLIRADSPDEAYAKSLDLGRQQESSYKNPEGKVVTASFRGLGYLDVIHDKLEHGAELLYQRSMAVPKEEVQKWVLTREQLPLFRESQPPPDYPNYGSKDIVEEAKALAE